MTQNLLVQRFKNAKSELTALKTTHPRGIGNLKIYKETITFTGSEFFLEGTVTINFSQNFAAYPFVYLVGYGVRRTVTYFASIGGDSVNYINNGYTAVFEATALYYPGTIPNKFDVYCTSPMTSITYTWT